MKLDLKVLESCSSLTQKILKFAQEEKIIDAKENEKSC